MRRGQFGAALLTAMLTVALVATFAAAALWQQWRSIEVESAERARVQSGWILTGALDWARLLLREDARSGSDRADHLGEPWAVPLQEARLSSFLAADQNATADAEPGVMDAFLSGEVTDLQSLLNVNNLVSATGVDGKQVESFARLFAMLGLPQSELEKLVENLRFAVAAASTSTGTAQAPLQPQRVEQLTWLGLSPDTVAALQPYVTLLPTPPATPVNLNTARAEVIAAAAGLDLAQAQQLVQARQGAHFRAVADAQRILGDPTLMAQAQGKVDVASRFFEVRARLRLDQATVEERSVLQRDGLTVVVIQRERGVPAAQDGSPGPAPARR